MNTEAKDIQESLRFLVENMATKDDIAELRGEMVTSIAELRQDIRALQADIRDIRQDIESLAEQVGNLKGFSVEIGDLLIRVAALEKEIQLLKQSATV